MPPLGCSQLYLGVTHGNLKLTYLIDINFEDQTQVSLGMLASHDALAAREGRVWSQSGVNGGACGGMILVQTKLRGSLFGEVEILALYHS